MMYPDSRAIASTAAEVLSMSKINWVRVLLGGLVAGVVINVIEFITNGIVLASDWDAAFKAAGRTMTMSAAGGVLLIIWGFLMGIGAVWLYAAARPRFGPGMKTAALTGVAFWALSSGLCAFDEAVTGLYPARLVISLALVCLVQAVLASVAGAWVYKEQAA
jgi:hypothetical protein